MNISNALKEKNRITGRIAQLQKKVKNYNQYEGDETPDFNSLDLLTELQEEWAYLIALKTRVSMANVGIVGKLVQLAEAKAELKFWEDMESYSGRKEAVKSRAIRVKGEWEEHEVKAFSLISSIEVQSNITATQKRIESIQDEIDTFNGITQI